MNFDRPKKLFICYSKVHDIRKGIVIEKKLNSQEISFKNFSILI